LALGRIPVGKLLGALEGSELGALLGLGDFVGGSEAIMVGFCDG
jgi:hypothetical protein